MKSVILFIPTLAVAGAEVLVLGLAEWLHRRGWRVAIAVTTSRTPGPLLDKALATGIEVIDVSSRWRIVSVLKILRLLLARHPDAVHTHLSSLFLVMFPAWLARVPRRVHTFHSLAGPGDRKTLCRIAVDVLSFQIAAIASPVARSVEEYVGLPHGKVAIVPNGVDLSRFCVPVTRPPAHPTVFIAVGRLSAVKDHALLVSSFVGADISDAELWIVGDGPERDSLQSAIAGMGADGRIRLLGAVTDVVPLLQRASIFVSSSKVEGMPISMLEAMACGLPIVSTCAGGVVDLVEPGRNGLLAAVGDGSGLALGMRTLARDEPGRRRMGGQSRRIAERFGMEATGRSYADLYAGSQGRRA